MVGDDLAHGVGRYLSSPQTSLGTPDLGSSALPCVGAMPWG